MLTWPPQGVSYTLSTISLPSLLTLPSAKPAAYTLAQTFRLASLHIRTLSTISTVALALAFWLSPSRVRHPYLIWTSLVAASAGAMNLVADKSLKERRGGRMEEDMEDVNGEEVERRARGLQWLEGARTLAGGAGFVMSVVGIWGDKA